MKIVKWAAVAVTGLFVLMNFGAMLEPDVDTPFRVVGAVLGLVGAAAAVGSGASLSWGRAAVIAVGGLNVIGSIFALFADQQGAVIGIVVGGLGAVLGVLAATETKRTMAV